MEKLNLNTSLFEISLNKYDDLLVINSADLSVFEGFTKLYENIEKIANKAKEEVAKLEKQYGQDEDTNTDVVMKYVSVAVHVSKCIMEELNKVFGDDFTDKVYRESYEINPDFVPDELALYELVEALIPVVEKAFGERIKRRQNKYNAGKRGKHTKTKEELLAEYKEKSGLNA